MQNQNKYQQYQAEDFAQDERFIAWVQQQDAAEDAFWKAWLDEHSEKQEEVAKARALVQMMQTSESDISDEHIDKLWGKIEQGMGTEGKQLQMTYSFWQKNAWKMAIAASLSLVLVFFFLLRDQSEVIKAPLGEQMTYTLPDASIVTLNAGSEITFDPSDWEQNRQLQLKGEAFFEVEKGSRFQVISTYGTIEVLGTSFNVYARNQKLEVACFTGKVKVSDAQGKLEQVLNPGHGVLLSQNQLRPFDVDLDEGISWRKGDFIFEDVPLTEVLEELERQYNLDVVLQTEILGRKYSGQFTNHDLKGALQMICLPMELSYELDRNNHQVIIRQE